MIRLEGQLIAANPGEVALIRLHLPAHLTLTRAEPGCFSFDVTITPDPLVWYVTEVFADRPAFDAHQTRTKASAWFAATRAIRRDYKVSEE